MKRDVIVGSTFAAVLALLGAGSAILKHNTVQAAGVMAPRFEGDPIWPKPRPNHWLLGQTIRAAVDAADHIWIIHRAGSLEPGEQHLTSKQAQCCAAAPPVLEFDQAGNLLHHWGGPGQGYDWPDSNHGITIDYKGNVWIGGRGPRTPAAGGGGPGSPQKPPPAGTQRPRQTPGRPHTGLKGKRAGHLPLH